MPRPFFDAASYQSRINQILPVNRDGQPVVRLSWAPEVISHALGERTPRYWSKRWRSDGDWRYEQPERWVLEKRLEREAYFEAHSAARWFTNEHGEVVDLGAPPPEFYTTFRKIAVHDTFRDPKTGEPWCCAKKYEEDRQVCWGLEGEAGYRAPNDADLQLIAEAVRQMEADPFYDPYKPLSREQLTAIELAATHDVQRIEEEKRAVKREQGAEFAHVVGNLIQTRRSFSSEAFKAGFKRYRDLTGGFAKQGGIYVPEKN